MHCMQTWPCNGGFALEIDPVNLFGSGILAVYTAKKIILWKNETIPIPVTKTLALPTSPTLPQLHINF